jgi:hypothetical protein
MARGDHGLPKVSPGLTMPNPSTPCRRDTPETALLLFRGWPTRRAGGRLLPFWIPHAVRILNHSLQEKVHFVFF